MSGFVTVKSGDNDYVAEFAVDNGLITVTAMNESKTTQIGNSQPEALARIILSEMIAAETASDTL